MNLTQCFEYLKQPFIQNIISNVYLDQTASGNFHRQCLRHIAPIVDSGDKSALTNFRIDNAISSMRNRISRLPVRKHLESNGNIELSGEVSVARQIRAQTAITVQSITLSFRVSLLFHFLHVCK